MSLRWYILHVYSGFEKKVAETITERAQKHNVSELITRIVVPTEDVIEIKRGKKISQEKRFFPGYVLIQMDLNDNTWHLVRDVPNVSGFLGAQGKPAPISDAEAERILQQVADGVDKPKMSVAFEVGEQVRVCEGPFASFNGIVEEVDEERSRVKVSVSIFGRATPVELEYAQVEKVLG